MSTTFIHSLCDVALSPSCSLEAICVREQAAISYLLQEREGEREANISVFMLLQRPTNYATRPTDRVARFSFRCRNSGRTNDDGRGRGGRKNGELDRLTAI